MQCCYTRSDMSVCFTKLSFCLQPVLQTIQKWIKLLSKKLDVIENSINNHNTDIALIQDKQQTHESRINDHAQRLRQLEQKVNS